MKNAPSKWVENTGKKTSNFSFTQSVFKRLVLQTPKKQGLIGRPLRFTRMREQQIRLRRGRLLLLCRQNTEGE